MNKIGRSWSYLSEIKVGVGLEELELFCVEAAGFYSHCCARKNFLESKINSDTFICLQPTHCRKEVSPIIPVSTFSFASPLSFFSLRSILSFLLLLCLLLDRRQETGFELFQVSATYKVTVYIDWSSTIFFYWPDTKAKYLALGWPLWPAALYIGTHNHSAATLRSLQRHLMLVCICVFSLHLAWLLGAFLPVTWRVHAGPTFTPRLQHCVHRMEQVFGRLDFPGNETITTVGHSCSALCALCFVSLCQTKALDDAGVS